MVFAIGRWCPNTTPAAGSSPLSHVNKFSTAFVTDFRSVSAELSQFQRVESVSARVGPVSVRVYGLPVSPRLGNQNLLKRTRTSLESGVAVVVETHKNEFG